MGHLENQMTLQRVLMDYLLFPGVLMGFHGNQMILQGVLMDFFANQMILQRLGMG